MPPYALPANRTQSGIKSRSSLAGGAEDFNELRFEDKKDAEDICFHAQKDFHRVVENDDDLKVGHDQKIEIKNNRTETVQEGNEKVTVSKGNRDVEITLGNETLTIKKGNQTTKINLGKSETQALQSIVLKVGKSSITVDQQGVKIKGLMVQLEGQIKLDIDAPLTSVSGKGMLTLRGGLTQIN
jgi:type VI secretion system secreted protein VgrG